MTALLMVNGQPNPGGEGRYCMPLPGTCYCGGCPHHTPLPAYDASHVAGSLDWRRKHNRPAVRSR